MCGFGAPSQQRWELWLHVTLNLIWVNSRIGAFTSSSRKSSGEKGMFAGGSPSLVLLVFYISWTASCQPGSCRVQCFCVGGSASACRTSLMLLSFQFLFWGEGGNAENEGEREAIKQGYNWRKVGRGKKNATGIADFSAIFWLWIGFVWELLVTPGLYCFLHCFFTIGVLES